MIKYELKEINNIVNFLDNENNKLDEQTINDAKKSISLLLKEKLEQLELILKDLELKKNVKRLPIFMPAYKDEKSKKWYVSFYIKENGISKKVKKMGFNKKQEAMEYERNYINFFVSDTEIISENLCKSYMNDLKNRLKLHTIETKKYLINKKILPFFQKYKIKEITPLLVRKWQNELMEKNYAQTYLRTINNQLVAILNYAVKFHNLKKNPCLAAETIEKKNADEMNVWTIQEFNKFIKAIEHKKGSVVGLFYTGIRIGELLALTISDIDFEKHKIRINKSFQ